MELLFATLIFLIGLGVLITGAEIFIHHSAQLGAKLGISDVVVGITLVALGTSIPEIFVSISSIINDAPALALGNSIGSNISNIAIIYGLSLFWLSSKTLNISLRNIFILILSVLIAGWALYDLTITVADSVVFIALFILFVLNLFREKPEEVSENTHKDESITKASFLIILSLILLAVGSELTVEGGVDLAVGLGIPDAVIGLTMIAIGTSLPELAASISALRRNKGNMVVGNIVGSNILNVVLIFPIIGIGSTAIFDQEIFSRDFMVMSIFSAAFILLISIGRQDLDIKKVLYPVFGIGMFISIAFYLTSLF
jgi:cation:H+ antiporter